MSNKTDQFITDAWYQGAWWIYLLWPLSMLYGLIVYFRKKLYQVNCLHQEEVGIPVIVVGNITVGGTGKSPLVAYLVRALKEKGYHPGIISRGYGASIEKTVFREVLPHSSPDEVGDEPLMLKNKLGCPVIVSPTRALAAKALENVGCDIVISDDGLQHYALVRDLEICVFDAQRLWGNGHLLPAGPLREPLSRLHSVDILITNGRAEPELFNLGPKQRLFTMQLKPDYVVSLDAEKQELLAEWAGRKVHAVAGIGHPERFFNTLRQAGIELVTHTFGDHHPFRQDDFIFDEHLPIIMTEKDAVKCRSLALDNAWFVPVSAEFDEDLAECIVQALQTRKRAP